MALSGKHPNLTSTTPRVGIFWLVADCGRDVLVSDSVPITEAEPYGAFLTHPRGHYEVWDQWQSAGPRWLEREGLPTSICETEYEQHARGRIVYDRPADLFIVYADRRLQTADIIKLIAETFRLTGKRFVVRSDEHYR